MRVTKNWKEYTIIDTSSGEKLEQWGEVILCRPDPQVIWRTPKKNPLWNKADAVYHRSSQGGGQWAYHKSIPPAWTIGYKELRFQIKPTGFKHTGLFPEQGVNWDYFMEKIHAAHRPIRVLNLFAYTGGATLACLSAGASVCHVDASQGMVSWARENATLSGLEKKPVRWMVDDCEKFIRREQKRGNQYDAIIMDPPSYGRGPGGEIWKLEDMIYDFVALASTLLSDNPLFFAVNSYTTGLSPSVMGYILSSVLPEGNLICDEIGLPVQQSTQCLPCGSTAIWEKL